MERREFLASAVKAATAASGAALLTSCSKTGVSQQRGHRVLVIAFDGLDPKIIKQLMDAGRMPNLAKLAAKGSFSRIATSTPPHTPVAFSNIISGADASEHQVYDFIHRDPKTMRPYFSTADVVASPGSWLPDSIPLGDNWQVPLTGGETKLLRRGNSFWDYLIKDGIDTQVYYLPANYPPPDPQGSGQFLCISGMGTPDLLGGYGEFTMLTPDAPKNGRTVDGGRFTRLRMRSHRGSAQLLGPPDFLAKSLDAPRLATTINVVRDSSESVVKIQVGGQVRLLKKDEWSDWIPIEFVSQMPGASALGTVGAPTRVKGMARMFVRQVHPDVHLYVSPINIDPRSPINRVSTPSGLAADLSEKFGPFHTLGIPEDTKALSHGALNESQFIQQSHAVFNERSEQFLAALKNFKSGCLFFYFGATDLLQHMFWRDRDPQHPGRVEEQVEKFEKVIEETYVGIDQRVGQSLGELDETDTLIVMSDHGFTSFRRGFNLNSWLVNEGFIKLKDPAKQDKAALFDNVDWSKTKMYGLGLNALYINEKGREKNGIVNADDRKSLVGEVRDKLQTVRDEDGSAVVDAADVVAEVFSNPDPNTAPDMIVGYGNGYRGSWETVLGGMPWELLQNNLDRWSGTHLTAPAIVPGMLVSSKKVTAATPTIADIAPTILAEFGIAPPNSMTGKPLFGDS